MCFGVKHAPLTFHKTLRPVIRIIREELGVRILAYCDDIIIIYEDKEKLIEAKDSIINILMNFGWKIAMNKSVLEPTRVITFLRRQINMNKDQLMMTEERQAKMKGLIGRRRRIIQQGRIVKVKFLASFLGSLNFLRLQIRRGGLHMRKLNKIKSQTAMYKGWNSYLHLQHNTLQEIFWWKSQIDKNKPIQATIAQPEAILTTYASLHSWRSCLKLMNPAQQIWFQGNWSSRWNLNSSNQREAAAILCALRRSEPYFKERQTKSLKIETDNSSAAFNINRGAAATALAKLVDRTLETADNYNLQLHAYHIPGTQNKIPDSLSRLATSGDYMINQQILNEALHILRVKPSIDLFSNRRNRRFKRRSPIPSPANPINSSNIEQAGKREGECSDGSSQLAFPIMVAEPNEVDLEVDNRGKKRRRINPGRENEEIKKTSTSRRDDSIIIRGNKGEELFRWVLEQRGLATAAVNKVIEGWHTIWGRHRQRLGQFQEYWVSIGKSREELLRVEDPEVIIANFVAYLGDEQATDSNQTNCRTAISMLFKLQEFPKEKVNGSALHQILKKPQTAMRKNRKEEPLYNLDILLRYLQEKNPINTTLSEQEHLGCTVTSIMAFSTLRLIEIYRAKATKQEKGAWTIQTSKFKGIGYDVSLTFRPLSNKSVCPTTWITSWLARRNKENRKKCLWWLQSKGKEETYEQISKAVHMVMNAVGINKKETVTSIRKASITKGIDQ
ncbi:MAG: hypothetical protein EZS28_021675 [Streblomastix strix]|uniref:Reverse transcriptase domain-containing protein n=1 Tax=Streblomastix strix TaxID=222440 RepID=A0A5J4VKD3_9EUKA|nr:MAG: hypothetical protein EZS28_021675 [Streblomastix strix]